MKPPKGYRWLRPSENIRRGDKWFARNTGEFLRTYFAGSKVGSRKYIRKINA